MPVITAVCPYCSEGRVRAPDRAVGLSATCPNCRASFTLMPSAEPAPPVARAAADTTPAPALGDTRPMVADPLPAPVVVVPGPVIAVPPADVPEPALAPALVALTAGGAALLASQLPFGRISAVVLAAGGLLLAVFTLAFAERKRFVPGLATGLNAGVILLALAFPWVLGLGVGWVPAAPAEDPRLIKAFDHATGEATTAGDRVDAAKASWQQDDVRVTVLSAAVAPVELVGPGGKKKWAKDRVLQLVVRVANEGVARTVTFSGWVPPLAAPALTDAAGKSVPVKVFEAGHEPAAPATSGNASLFPGKSAEQTFYFDAPKAVTDLSLDLPGAGFGGPAPVTFRIPRSMIAAR